MQTASMVPQAGRANQGQRARLVDESRVQVAQHDLPFEFGTEAEVELLDGRGKREAGLAQPLLGGGIGARGAFFFEQTLQEIGVAQLLGSSAVQPIGEHARRLVQAEVLEHGLEAASRSRRQAHASTPVATTMRSSVSGCVPPSGVHT
jgi:hypothetical protein